MEKKNKIRMISIIVAALIVLFGLWATVQNKKVDALNNYYYNQIEPLKVEENLNNVTTQLTTLQQEIQKEQENGTLEWDQMDAKINKVIGEMVSKKEELEKLQIEDEKVKEIHQYLINTYDTMIDGYTGIMESIKNQDENKMQEATNKVLQAKDLITTWQQKLNE